MSYNINTMLYSCVKIAFNIDALTDKQLKHVSLPSGEVLERESFERHGEWFV